MLILNNSYMVTLESALNLKTHGFQGTFCDIVIIFEGAYRYCRATCLNQVSKYITLKSTNNILNIT